MMMSTDVEMSPPVPIEVYRKWPSNAIQVSQSVIEHINANIIQIMIIFNDHIQWSFIMFYHLLPMFHPVEVFDMDGWSVRLLHRRGIPICDPLQQLVVLVQGCALRLAVVQRRRCFHFHGKKMQHSEYWNPPWNWSSLISPRKNHSISLVEKRHGCPAKKCPLWVKQKIREQIFWGDPPSRSSAFFFLMIAAVPSGS